MSEYQTRVIRKHLRFFGMVQGVGFRYRATHAASSIGGVTGWVRNNPDGSVSMEIQATEEKIDQVIGIIDRGSFVHIRAMDAVTIPVDPQERNFLVADD